MARDHFDRSHVARFGIGLAALAALALGLAGCGVRDDHTAGAVEGDERATLPTLPPAEERLDRLYDENGCLLLSDGPPDCGASAESLDEALAGEGRAATRTLAGFEGPLFVTDVSRDSVLVLEDTVTATTAGAWRASGLLRNETTSPVLAPVVTATLRATDGTELAQARGAVAVAPVRPGEPAPFTIESDIDASTVAAVEWVVADTGVEPTAGTRDLELTTYFVEPAGEREPLDLYLYRETGNGPRPYVLFGSVTDLAGIDTPRPTVVAAWLGEDGRVRAVTEAPAVDPDGSVTTALAPGGSADFLLRVDDSLADGLDSSELLLWAVSR